MTATPKQQLASLLLGDDLETFVRDRRKAGLAWRIVARDLYEATAGKADITHETLRTWYPDDLDAEKASA